MKKTALFLSALICLTAVITSCDKDVVTTSSEDIVSDIGSKEGSATQDTSNDSFLAAESSEIDESSGAAIGDVSIYNDGGYIIYGSDSTFETFDDITNYSNYYYISEAVWSDEPNYSEFGDNVYLLFDYKLDRNGEILNYYRDISNFYEKDGYTYGTYIKPGVDVGKYYDAVNVFCRFNDEGYGEVIAYGINPFYINDKLYYYSYFHGEDDDEFLRLAEAELDGSDLKYISERLSKELYFSHFEYAHVFGYGENIVCFSDKNELTCISPLHEKLWTKSVPGEVAFISKGYIYYLVYSETADGYLKNSITLRRISIDSDFDEELITLYSTTTDLYMFSGAAVPFNDKIILFPSFDTSIGFIFENDFKTVTIFDAFEAGASLDIACVCNGKLAVNYYSNDLHTAVFDSDLNLINDYDFSDYNFTSDDNNDCIICYYGNYLLNDELFDASQLLLDFTGGRDKRYDMADYLGDNLNDNVEINVKPFVNTAKVEINGIIDAINIAKNEIDFRYNEVNVAYDSKNKVYRIEFILAGLKEREAVYLSDEGVTLMTVNFDQFFN